MAFYRSVPALTPIRIPNDQLILRAPVSADFQAWQEVRLASKEFLIPWEPKWPENDLTRLGFRRRLKLYEIEREYKQGETYFLVGQHDNRPIGGISISNIRYGAAQTCSIGYWMGAEFTGRGHMGHALPVICNYIFEQLELCRIEAACLADNERSKKLLKKAGFRREGIVRNYLQINGKRRDHFLFSLLPGDLRV
jgi:ribosomal-protein-alanine N-acetyltransferase